MWESHKGVYFFKVNERLKSLCVLMDNQTQEVCPNPRVTPKAIRENYSNQSHCGW